MKIRHLLPIVAVLAAVAACGDPGPDVAVVPPPYGENGRCYYADDLDEVTLLRDAGRCPVNWVAYPMPDPWRAQYAWWYDSPSYYDVYVPAARRTTYVTHVKVFESSHPQAVRTPPKVNTKPQKGQAGGGFNAGTRPSGGDAASSRRSTTAAKPATAPRYQARPASGGAGGFSSGKRK